MAGSEDFLFVNSTLSSNGTRNEELQRSQALSHATRVSHTKHRKAHAADADKRTANQDFPSAVYASDREPRERQYAGTLGEDDTLSDEDRTNPNQSVNRRKKSYNVHRWRLIQKNSRSHVRGANWTKRSGQNMPVKAAQVPRSHKGNSDPFNSTPVPLTALDIALIRDDRTNLIDIVWPAEISIRKNHSSLLGEVWKIMPGILDGPEIAHAIISHSHYSRAVRHSVRGQRDQKAMALAEKHKMLAVKGLRGLVEEYRLSQDQNLLKQIRGASAQLAACGVISGDGASAQVHFAGVKMAVDIMGGLKKMVPMQYEALVFSQVANAWFSRSRPIFHPSEWDPGSWSEYTKTLPKAMVSTLERSFPPSPTLHNSDELQPSAISSRMKVIIDDLREMVHVEEIKLALKSSRDDNAAQVFRWSSLRKLAIRARNIRLWCDLRDFVASPTGHQVQDGEISAATTADAAFNMIVSLAARTFDRAIFEEHYYHDQPTFRFSTMFLAEVAANLQRLSPPFPGYVESSQGSDEDGMVLGDERRFDMLWIYSVGAYVEACHIRPLARHSSTGSTESVVSSAAAKSQKQHSTDGGTVGPFGVRFSRLVKILGFESFEDVTTFLSGRYLYCPWLQSDSLMMLVDVGASPTSSGKWGEGTHPLEATA